jgi:hypothetical protein
MSSQGSQSWVRSPQSARRSLRLICRKSLKIPEMVRIHKSKKDRQLITKWQTKININRHLNQPFQ